MGFPFQRQSRPRERRGSPEPFVVSPDKSPASDSLPSPPVSRPRGKPRRKFECLRWGNIVINLPRHTREVHGIEPRKTKRANPATSWDTVPFQGATVLCPGSEDTLLDTTKSMQRIPLKTSCETVNLWYQNALGKLK